MRFYSSLRLSGQLILLLFMSFVCHAESICTCPNCGSNLDGGGKCIALLVGLDNYEFIGGNKNNLQYPESEVKNMAQFLCGQHFSVTTITQKNAAVDTVLNTLISIAKNADSSSRILFYFSGHGKNDTSTNRFNIVLNPISNQLSEMFLSADTIAAILTKSAAFQKIMLIDACYSGASQPPPIPITGTRYEKLSRHAFLSITTWNGKTRDNFFTPILLDGMKGKADSCGDNNGYVDAGELCKYIDRRVAEKPKQYLRPVIALLGAAGDFELFKVMR
jgi:hypothetical protein